VRRAGRHPLVRLTALVGVALLLGSCALIGSDSDLTTFEPAGPNAERIDDLFWLVFWIAAVVFALVFGAILVIVFFFRDRGRPEAKEPRQTHGSTGLEVAWTIIPALILAGIAIPTIPAIFDLTECSEDAMEVQVVGHQWWFEYRYPDSGVTTANILVIPVGEEVCAELTSDDVLHNFWIPALHGKRYLVPGQTTILPLEASVTGEFWGHCAEFCGLSHSLMRARVRVVERPEFDAWVDAQLEPATLPTEGEPGYDGLQVFLAKGCTQCHNVASEGDDALPPVPLDVFHGPDLTHFGSRNVFAGASLPEAGETKEEALKRWLADPPNVKPGSFMPYLALTEQEIDALIVWLESNE
jgi:cytochrome c oxidase subunit 2